eukprot:CAMPEP_0117619668 /NCGR_PEP_ID=MMETSP0784-20121206/86736_1 /TAXON_ID=39447 /ORGANISM="" /LENGTH=142 /DNA_ID=CAMNT_0005423567 /DNA_START=21 /DNA_END=449 /DNA_ORIENTATION=+
MPAVMSCLAKILETHKNQAERLSRIERQLGVTGGTPQRLQQDFKRSDDPQSSGAETLTLSQLSGCTEQAYDMLRRLDNVAMQCTPPTTSGHESCTKGVGSVLGDADAQDAVAAEENNQPPGCVGQRSGALDELSAKHTQNKG